jgi:hypothetical protein
MSEETNQSTFTLSCWGCHKEVVLPYTGAAHLDKQLSSQMKDGWVRRKFAPNAEAWFCSLICAYQSLPAKQAEEWWGKQKLKSAHPSLSQINKTTIYLFGVVVVSFVGLLALSLWK